MLKKALQGVLKERHVRGMRREGVMKGTQYAYEEGISTSVPLCVMNMTTEWAVVHRMEMWDAHRF